MKKSLGSLLAILLLACAGCRHLAVAEADALAATTKPADRLVLYENSSETARQVPLAVGHAIVDAAQQRREVAVGFECLCGAEFVAIWYKGDGMICAVGLQRDAALSWTNGPLAGDMLMDEETYSELHERLDNAFLAGKPMPGYITPRLE